MSSLSTPDLDGAKAFYGAVFGWETDTFSVGEISATLWRLPGSWAASRRSRCPPT